jgi:hypothetical protein
MRLNFCDNFQRTWATVAVAGVSTGISVYKGLHAASEDKKAAREGAAMKRPFYSVPSEDIINRNIWGQSAEQGLSSAEKQYAGEQRERGLATSAHALSETGAGVNQFGELDQVFADSLKSQSALDAQEHKQNIDMFTKANSEISAQKGIQFGINELQPYESKLKEIQDRRTAAKTNENNAINEGLGSASAAATGINSYLSTKQPPAEKPGASPYNRTFGLANTGATGGSPAADFTTVDPNSFSQSALAVAPPDQSDNF